MSLYHYTYPFDEGELNCELDFQPEERTTHWDPGCSAVMELTAAKIKDVDIYDLLDPNFKRVIESKALNKSFQDAKEAIEDARIEAYRDRIESWEPA